MEIVSDLFKLNNDSVNLLEVLLTVLGCDRTIKFLQK